MPWKREKKNDQKIKIRAFLKDGLILDLTRA
jgi:hypothetical protein